MKISTNKKKVIVIIAMVLLLVGTGCLNYFLTIDNSIDTDIDASADDNTIITEMSFFDAYREDREATRAQTIMYLDEIIASEVSSTDAIVSAEDERLGVVSSMETELVLEGLIKATGFEDCVVTMGTSNVNVVVKTDTLSDEQIISITDLIVTETSTDPSKVVIISYN